MNMSILVGTVTFLFIIALFVAGHYLKKAYLTLQKKIRDNVETWCLTLAVLSFSMLCLSGLCSFNGFLSGFQIACVLVGYTILVFLLVGLIARLVELASRRLARLSLPFSEESWQWVIGISLVVGGIATYIAWLLGHPY